MLYVNSCCCTCLAQEGLQSIHNKDSENVTILEKVINCLLEKDSIFDSAPLLICDKCYKHVDELYKFKKVGLRNLDLFRNCLKQLIKNPFSNLSINVTPETDKNIEQGSSAEVVAHLEPQEVRQEVVVIKVEPAEVNDNQELETKRELQRNHELAMDLQINNVESLSQASQNYRNPLSKNSSSKFQKSTICVPCDKRFIRDDYYLRHILSCTKNDAATKNSVLRWAEERTINIRGNTIPLLDTMLNQKQIPVKHLGRKVKRPLERSFCKYCKKRIATKFMPRHYKNCISKQIRDDSSCHNSSSNMSSTDLARNMTM